MAEDFNYVLGVDLGTSKFSVAVVIGGHAEILCNDIGGRSTPSSVFVDLLRPFHEWTVGMTANQEGQICPQNLITNSKLLLGISPSECVTGDLIGINPQGRIVIFLDNENSITINEVIARFFGEIRTMAKEHLSCDVVRAVVTVPNYFSDRHCVELKESAYFAGFREVKTVTDSSAAAVAYAHLNADTRKEQTIVIVDVGSAGGNVCIFNVNDRMVAILARSTVNLPGGEDFSERLLDYLLQEARRQYGIDITNVYSLAIIRQQCEAAKQKLSRVPEVTIKCFLPCIQMDFNVCIQRGDFEALCSDLFLEIITRIREVVISSKATTLDKCITVGGSTRIPALRTFIKEATGCEHLFTSLNADEAMALGAAFLGANTIQVVEPTALAPMRNVAHPPSWYKGAPITIDKCYPNNGDALDFLYNENVIGELLSPTAVSREQKRDTLEDTEEQSKPRPLQSPIAAARKRCKPLPPSSESDSDSEDPHVSIPPSPEIPSLPPGIASSAPLGDDRGGTEDDESDKEESLSDEDNNEEDSNEDDDINGTDDEVPYYLRVGKYTLSDVLNFVERVAKNIPSGRYPANCPKEKRSNFRTLCKPFIYKNGELQHKTHLGKNSVRGRHNLKMFPAYVPVVMSRKKQLKVIKIVHEGSKKSLEATSLSMHRGETAVVEILSRRVYWPGITQDIKMYVRSCDNCQRVNPALLKVHKPLQSIPPPRNILKQIGVDLIQLPESNGFRYVVVAIDYLSKYPSAKALKDKSAAGVARFLFEWISIFGCPEVIINDQGREFCNEVTRELQRKTGVKQRVTRPYHPQANGQVERENRSIKAGLLKVLMNRVTEWPHVLDGVLFALRTQVQRSTGYSPFYMVFQQEPVLPIDIELEKEEEVKEDEEETAIDDEGLTSRDDTAEAFIEKHSDPDFDIEYLNTFVGDHLALKTQVLSKARENIKDAQKTQAHYYNKRNNTHLSVYKTGDKVMLKNLRKYDRKGGWQEETYRGPYIIVKLQGRDKTDCVLKNCRSGRTLAQVHSVDNLKQYVDRSPGLEVHETSEDESDHERDDKKNVKNSAKGDDAGTDTESKKVGEDESAQHQAAKGNVEESGKGDDTGTDTESKNESAQHEAAQGNVEESSKGKNPNDQEITPESRNQSVPVLKNGNRLPPVKINKEKYVITNTCGFDSVVQLLAVAMIDSPPYAEYVNSKELPLFSVLKDLLKSGLSENTYVLRAKVLVDTNSETRSTRSGKALNAACGVSELLPQMLHKETTCEEQARCDAEECPKKVRDTIRRCVVTIHTLTGDALVNLELLMDEYLQHRLSGCKATISKEVFCPGMKRVDLSLKGNHIFIEPVQQENNAKRLLQCYLRLECLPHSICLQEQMFWLRGAVAFVGSDTTTLGHYIAYAHRRNNVWEMYDDLSGTVQIVDSGVEIKCHLLFYSI